MLGWLPIIGPVIEGIVAVIKGRQDTSVKMATLASGERVEQIKASNDLTKAFVDDVGVRICRDMIMFPGSIYCGTIIWDRFMDQRHPELVWGVLPLQGAIEYLPYALLTFFFGSAYLMWKQR